MMTEEVLTPEEAEAEKLEYAAEVEEQHRVLEEERYEHLLTSEWDGDLGIMVSVIGECPFHKKRMHCGICGLAPTISYSAEEVKEANDWKPVDLKGVLSGLEAQPAPVRLCRTDGPCLLYDGKVHALNAEAESGKTWIALLACADEVRSGGHAFYFDYESDAVVICERLVSLGLEESEILAGFHYWRPDGPLTKGAVAAIEREAEESNPGVVVFDGVSEIATHHGWSINDNNEMTALINTYPRPFARRGAAALVLDHVGRDPDRRNGHAIGAQAKKAGVDVAYELVVAAPMSRGGTGRVNVFVRKDRPGHVRSLVTGARDLVANVHFVSTPLGDIETAEVVLYRMDVQVLAPGGGGNIIAQGLSIVRPLETMEAVSRFLELAERIAEPPSKNAIKDFIGGRASVVDNAIRSLIDEGFVDIRLGPNRSHLHVSIRPFRQ